MVQTALALESPGLISSLTDWILLAKEQRKCFPFQIMDKHLLQVGDVLISPDGLNLELSQTTGLEHGVLEDSATF